MLNISIFIFGMVIGSFLNVCIFRLPQHESTILPPSHCSKCGAKLRPIDLVPIISYVWLRGHCRYCQAAISLRYPLVEVLTAVLFVWCYQVLGLSPALVKAWLLAAFLITIAFIDYDHQLIFDRVLIYLAIIGMVLNVFFIGVDVIDMILASLMGGSLFLVIALVSRGGMGGGDIKFVTVLGLWLGWQHLLLAIFLSFLLGGGIGAILLLLRLKGRKDMIPFGPFIAMAAYIANLYGTSVVQWYMRRVFF